MKYLELTLPHPQGNLACDEALLQWCEAGYDHEILRFWEPQQYFVVLGYTNKVHTEVDFSACQERGIPVLRRCSGGGTVLQGPGCLNYSLLLRIQDDNLLSSVTDANSFIMNHHREALQTMLRSPVAVQGFTDLALGGLKFSGNAQRRKRRFLLFHGTFLLDFDIALVEKALRMPSKQPSYRDNRSHTEFLTNLHLPAHTLKETLRSLWNADEVLEDAPFNQIDSLVRQKYSTDEWNLKF